MPAIRPVVAVLLRGLGDVSLHPQGQPALGRQGAVMPPAFTQSGSTEAPELPL
jgi:hypothetical protein